MKIAFTYNLRLTDVRETEKEAEYDSAETVNAIAAGIRRRVMPAGYTRVSSYSTAAPPDSVVGVVDPTRNCGNSAATSAAVIGWVASCVSAYLEQA